MFENLNHDCNHFDLNTITGMSNLSELEKPLYYFISKRKITKLIYMTPKEYLEIIAKNFKLSYEDTISGSSVDESKVDKYVTDMKNGDKFPTIWYDKNRSLQEGRHRALACLKLDCDKIPVLEFDSNISYDDVLEFINNKRDYTFDQMDQHYKDMGYKGITMLGYNDFKRFVEYN